MKMEFWENMIAVVSSVDWEFFGEIYKKKMIVEEINKR